MFKKVIVIASVLAMTACGQYSAQQSNQNEESNGLLVQAAASSALAFPGAMGFGRFATGGRGGKVIKVTNLNNSGSGSLRAAVEASGPRIVVFAIGGVIDLETAIEVKNPHLTVAGQTAPGNGVVIRGSRFVVQASNVIVRGMRFRPGDESGSDAGDQRDGFGIGRGTTLIENIIFDSNSVSWSVDEAMSIWGRVNNLTLSNNLAAESLRYSIHPKGRHSMGLVIGQKAGEIGPSNITIYRNAMGNSMFRCPLVKYSKNVEFINNYCFNFANFFEQEYDNTIHYINNFLEQGDNSSRSKSPINLIGSNNKVYITGNLDRVYRTSDSQPDTDIITGASSQYSSKPLFTGSGVDIIPARNLKDNLLASVGAMAPRRDDNDVRIVNTFRNRISQYQDTSAGLNGYSNYPKGTTPKDSDNDGIPDSVETAMGFNPNQNDAAQDRDGDGYTNIEEYINGLLDGYDNSGSTSDSGSSSNDSSSNDSSSSSDNDSGSSATGESILVEAEDMQLESGFVVKSSGVSSGDKMIQSTGSGVASYDFDGAAGTYKIRIAHFDENDGEVHMDVLVNGKVVFSFDWDQELGSNLANQSTLTTRTSANVQLAPGDVIELSGTGTNSEPLRTDSMELLFQSASSSSGSGSSSGSTSSSGSLTEIFVEAEALNLSGDYVVVNNGVASGSKFIQCNGSGSASYTFTGASGNYVIEVGYFDENDAVATMSVTVNGSQLDSWRWDSTSGSNLANSASFTTRNLPSVYLKAGDVIQLSAVGSSSEPARTDYLRFKP